MVKYYMYHVADRFKVTVNTFRGKELCNFHFDTPRRILVEHKVALSSVCPSVLCSSVQSHIRSGDYMLSGEHIIENGRVDPILQWQLNRKLEQHAWLC